VAFGLAALLLVAAVGLRLSRLQWRISWPAPAFAGAVLVVVALILQPWPARYSRWPAGPAADRGGARATLVPTISGHRVSWSPVKGADEHRVELFDVAGVPIASPIAATPPFDLPAAATDGWLRVEARQHGQPLARSALIRVAPDARR